MSKLSLIAALSVATILSTSSAMALGIGNDNSTNNNATANAVNNNSNTAVGVGVGVSNVDNVNRNNNTNNNFNVNANRNNNSNSNTNLNTNLNSNENRNNLNNTNRLTNTQGQGQDQQQGQIQGQGQQQGIYGSGNSVSKSGISNSGNSSSGSNSNVTGSGNSENSVSNNVTVEDNSVYEAQKRNPVSTAYSGPLTATDDTCMGSTSAGAQGVSFGVSLGSTWQDKDCVRRKDARELHNMGMKTAALALMCKSADVRAAMETAGTPCPGAESAPVASAATTVRPMPKPYEAEAAQEDYHGDFLGFSNVKYTYPTSRRN